MGLKLFADALFFDALEQRLNRCVTKNDYDAFLKHLGSLKFLDPACGCGNFLVIAYRELRRLEMDAIEKRFGREPSEGEIRQAAQMQVDQFYGIEIEEWPALIAEVAMWLMDHQLNNELFARFGTATPTVPLTRSPTIRCDNALRIDWNSVLPAEKCGYILGNPPFVGKHLFTPDQTRDMKNVWGDSKGIGVLDYVTAWYRRAAKYMGDKSIKAASVSTNSITQGEQVAPLWDSIFEQGFFITFAHRTFRWESEARGKAHVQVVIVGFAKQADNERKITEYDRAAGNSGSTTIASNITPYLTEGSSLTVKSRSKPLAEVPATQYGNKPTDGGALMLEDSEKARFLKEHPCAKTFVKPMLSADEYLDGRYRWCLWLVDASPSEIRQCPGVLERVKKVRQFRQASKKKMTRDDAAFPARFAEIRQPRGNFLLIPQHSSERRDYIPFGFFGPEYIVHNSCTAIPDATLYHFGILQSAMHMAWVRQVCGRLKSDFRYSARLVYNNFPWPSPKTVTAAQKKAVERAAQAVLDARAAYLPPKGSATLADLYDPLTMPANLAKAHAALDAAVDRCYRSQSFPDERHRFEYLFSRYEFLIAPLTAGHRKKKK